MIFTPTPTPPTTTTHTTPNSTPNRRSAPRTRRSNLIAGRDRAAPRGRGIQHSPEQPHPHDDVIIAVPGEPEMVIEQPVILDTPIRSALAEYGHPIEHDAWPGPLLAAARTTLEVRADFAELDEPAPDYWNRRAVADPMARPCPICGPAVNVRCRALRDTGAVLAEPHRARRWEPAEAPPSPRPDDATMTARAHRARMKRRRFLHFDGGSDDDDTRTPDSHAVLIAAPRSRARSAHRRSGNGDWASRSWTRPKVRAPKSK
jgi:hypothetical protein